MYGVLLGMQIRWQTSPWHWGGVQLPPFAGQQRTQIDRADSWTERHRRRL